MTMVEPTHADAAESALIVEKGKPQRIQAQFTRLQIMLGLKQSLTREDNVLIVY